MADQEDVTRKIAALLAKAEGTDNVHEAEAFFAKATEMMLRHAIDEARVRAAAGSGRTAEVIVRGDLDFDWFYAPAKEALISVVSRSQNVCAVLVHHEVSRSDRTRRRAALVGYARDVENVRMLYSSLIIQAIRDGALAYRGSASSAGKVKFMTSFIHGFAAAVNARINVVQEAARAADPTGMALVDARQSDVDDRLGDFFPSLRTVQGRRVNGSAYAAGHASGSRADVGNPGVAGQRVALGSGR